VLQRAGGPRRATPASIPARRKKQVDHQPVIGKPAKLLASACASAFPSARQKVPWTTRVAAGALGFLVLSQAFDGPDR
jgi:hypothetical protein